MSSEPMDSTQKFSSEIYYYFNQCLRADQYVANIFTYNIVKVEFYVPI